MNLTPDQTKKLIKLFDTYFQTQETAKIPSALENIKTAYLSKKLDDDKVKYISSLFRGSSTSALISSTFAHFSAGATISFISPLIHNMQKLTTVQRMYLASSQMLGGFLVMLIFSPQIDSCNSKELINIARMFALVGASALCFMSYYWDMSQIEGNDPKFFAILLANITTGACFLTFYFMATIMYWSEPTNLGFSTAVFSGVGNLAPGLSLITLHYFSKELGLTTSLMMINILFGLGTLATHLKLFPAPYHQLIIHGFTEEKAKEIAKLIGQVKFPSVVNKKDAYFKPMIKAFNNARTLSMFISNLSCTGCFLAFSSTVYVVFNKIFHLPTDTAVFNGAMSSITAAISRIVTGKLLDIVKSYDSEESNQSFYSLQAALIAIALGCAALGSRQITDASEVVKLIYILQAAFGSGAASTFRTIPIIAERGRNRISPGLVVTIAGIGAVLFGFMLPFISSIFVIQFGDNGYYNIFLSISVFATTACLFNKYINDLLNNEENQNPKVSEKPVLPGLFFRKVQQKATQMDRINTDPQGLDTDPQGLDTDPQGLDTDPQGLDTDPQGLDTDPQGLDTDPQGLDTDPQGLDTDPQGLDTDSQELDTDPQGLGTNLKIVPIPGGG